MSVEDIEIVPEWAECQADIKEKFSNLLGSIERSGVKKLVWSKKPGCVDIVFENDTRRKVPVQGDSEIAFMQDILKRLH